MAPKRSPFIAAFAVVVFGLVILFFSTSVDANEDSAEAKSMEGLRVLIADGVMADRHHPPPPPKGCKYNLRSLAVVRVNAGNKHYDDNTRQKLHNFVKNTLPEEFQPTCSGGPRRPWALPVYIDQKPAYSRNVGGCLSTNLHSHEIEQPWVGVFDCNGTMVACDQAYAKIPDVDKARDILVVQVAETQKKVRDSFFIYQLAKPFDTYCDYYPFDE